MDAPGDLPQLIDHVHELSGHVRDLGPDLAALAEGRRRTQPPGQRQEALLYAVMQVPLDLAAGRIRGRHDPRAGGDELGPVLRVRDRGRDQIGELRHPLLDPVRRRPLPGTGSDHPPQPPVDQDRHADRGPQPFTYIGLPAWEVAVIVNPGRLAGLPDGRGQPGRRVALPAFPHPHMRAGRALVGEQRRTCRRPRSGSSGRCRCRSAGALPWSPPRTPPRAAHPGRPAWPDAAAPTGYRSAGADPARPGRWRSPWPPAP